MTTKTNEVKLTDAFINKMYAIGNSLANGFLSAEDKANKTKRELILTNAAKFADNQESVKYILEGYAEAFANAGMNESTVKQRKSEANAIYKCVALTPITKDHLNALVAFVGGFNAMVDYARDLTHAHKQANATPSEDNLAPKVASVRPATALQLATVDGILQKANANELINVGDTILSELNRVEPSLAETSQFHLLANIAHNIMSNEHFDKGSIAVATEVYKLVNVHVNKLEAIQKQAANVVNDVMQIPAMM
jgi:hypothetical protein